MGETKVKDEGKIWSVYVEVKIMGEGELVTSHHPMTKTQGKTCVRGGPRETNSWVTETRTKGWTKI